MSNAAAAVIDVASDAVDSAAGAVSSGVKSAENAVSSGIKSAGDALGSAADSTANAARSAANTVENAAESGIKSAETGLGRFGAEEMVTGMPTASDSHKGAENGVLRWLTSAGMPTNGLFIGFAIMSLLAFINFCISAAANLGWNIFINLETCVAAAVLAANWATPQVYAQISGFFSKIFTNSQIRKYVWFAFNLLQWFFYIGGMANASLGSYCSAPYYDLFAGTCSKAGAIIFFDVVIWLGWTLSTVLAGLELFAPHIVPWIGWHTDSPSYDTKAADISTNLPEQSVV